jgi:PAS domain S-box-containing protein
VGDPVADMVDLSADAASIIDSLGIGFVSLDHTWRMTRVNAAAEVILGDSASRLVGRNLWEQFPGARELEFGQVYEAVMRTREPTSFDAYYPGLSVWFELRVQPIPGGIACYFLDITARKSAEQAVTGAAERSRFAADAMESLAASLDLAANIDQLARLVVPRLGTWSTVVVLDDDGSIIASSSWHGDVDRRGDVALFAATQLPAVLGALTEQAVASGQPVVLAANAAAALQPFTEPGHARLLFDAVDPQAVAVVPLRARGHTVGVLALFADAAWTDDRLGFDLDLARDIAARAAVAIDNSLAYARAHAARDDAEAANQRLSLLAEVSEVLAGTDDPDVAVGKLAHLVVPQLADWSLIAVVDDDGNLRDVGYAHSDPAKEKVLALYSARRSESMSESAPRTMALRTSEPSVFEHFSEAQLAAAQPDPAVFKIVRSLDPYGLATIPLTSRGRTFGVLTLATSSGRGPHTREEVASALEIARRAGPVLDSARAALHSRRLAESIQRSVLAVSPSRSDLEIATRYRPANVDREVGGDWYDTFTSPDGSTVVTIGDVMGHDVAAIAAMAQLRTFMQACAWTLQHSPAQVLSATDEAGIRLGREIFATALTADLAPPTPEGNVALRWSNAGHLPAVLIASDGSPSLLTTSAVDPPLGIRAGVIRHDHTCTLEPGSVLLLYTDGLIERRDRNIDDGIQELLNLAAALHGHNLDALLDELLTQLMTDRTISDDVALIAVRIGAGNQPRPQGGVGP